MAQVFISYSRRDREFVQKLVAALDAEKREVWLDEKDIEVTAEWLTEIFSNIEAADNFLFVISPDSVASANTRKEIDHAAINGKRMVPIYYRAVPDVDIPEAIARFQRIDFTLSTDFDSNFANLIKALDTDLDWKHAHTRLLTRAKEWERNGTDSSFLLRGKDLSEAEQWVVRSAEKEPKPTALHSQYILSSRQAATRTQRIIIGAVAIALVVAIGLAIYAFSQRNTARSETEEAQRNARESKAREFAAFATESLSDDPERSILLGMQAVNATLRFDHHTLPVAEDVLHQAILSSQVRRTLKGHTDSVLSVAWNPDGTRLATASMDKTAKVWDVVSGQELLTLKGHTNIVDSVAWSPDGKRLATASWDGTAKIWDASQRTGIIHPERRHQLREQRGMEPGRQAAGHDGSGPDREGVGCDWRTGAAHPEGSLRHRGERGLEPGRQATRHCELGQDREVWDAASGKVLLTLRGHTNNVLSVAWSPDGKQLATASADETAKVWDAASGQEVAHPEGPQRPCE